LTLKANYAKSVVEVKQNGGNSSSINGEKMEPGGQREVKHGDLIEILEV